VLGGRVLNQQSGYGGFPALFRLLLLTGEFHGSRPIGAWLLHGAPPRDFQNQRLGEE
jgi:hypothetical protein